MDILLHLERDSQLVEPHVILWCFPVYLDTPFFSAYLENKSYNLKFLFKIIA